MIFALTREDARTFEWESVVGQIACSAEDIKQYVEQRDYRHFRAEVVTTRVLLDEIEQRMNSEARVCSVCDAVIKQGPYGDVLDASERCDRCRP